MSDLSMDESTLGLSDYGEDSGGLYDGEGYDEDSSILDVDSYDDEASFGSARSRRSHALDVARRRRIALARARQRHGVRPFVSPPRSARAVVSAVQNLDLETKVQDDALRRELYAQRKRLTRSEMVAVASVVAGQIPAAFPKIFPPTGSPYARAALAATPLLLLSPQRRGSGASALISDPRFIGAALVLGVAFLADRSEDDQATANAKAAEQAADEARYAAQMAAVESIRITGSPSYASGGGTGTVVATPLNALGQPVPGKVVTFELDGESVTAAGNRLDVSGGTKQKPQVIVATVDGITNEHVIDVT